ncbi:MAG TPA: bifunctional diaminohydroxyphosphoribosylaminopyrimidine deaminase/5-amino-6-(5-phosphoribosylamino)uracil reductase RibD, partial [Agriterribacter sp.]|nr:bifunctional diaminohydroxyphosphoribosylaminopyrimidine deaminase/5-amino-6-(5-phosphoribosylamino)uracil reductase RibD [Agriterribacter sp.]
MQRCLQLARAGAGYVAPNPMVGAVLVHHNRVIGEGWHRAYGMSHAEVNCIASVSNEDRHLIGESVLYVSLEPCAHYGKTPPCANLIIQHRIPEVVVGCRDPFPEVNGKGIEKLQAAGIRVTTGVLEKECRELNKRFFIFYTQRRPFVVLKWAQSSDGAIAAPGGLAVQISNPYTSRLVHRWRSEEPAIVVGTRTAMLDDPFLTTRLWPGKHPLRVVIDRALKLPGTLRLFDAAATTLIFNEQRHTVPNGDR